MSSRLLCARFPHLGLLVTWWQYPELRGEAVALVVADRVVAASAPALAAGVRPGQAARTARQLAPAAVQLSPDATAMETVRETVLTALGAVVPSVELADEEAWCDLTGRHVQHAGEAAWAAAAARALTGALRGEAPAVGVASTRLVAWLGARTGVPHRIRRVRVGEEAAFLAPLAVGLLPADSAVLARLAALGIDRVGQVAALSPGDLRRQFGDAGLALHRLARGDDDLPLTPTTAPLRCVERVVLDGPVTDREVLSRCARLATARLGARLRERGLAAARLTLVLEGEDGTVGALERLPPVPVGSGEELWPAVLGLLGGCDPLVERTGPMAALRLEAAALAAAGGRQADLWRRGDAERDAVAVAVARVCDRFGAASVLRPRLAIDPGDLPERRFRWEPGSPLDLPAWVVPPIASHTAAVPTPSTAAPAPLRAPAAAGPSSDPRRRPVPPRPHPPVEAPVSRRRRERPPADGAAVVRRPLVRARAHAGMAPEPAR